MSTGWSTTSYGQRASDLEVELMRKSVKVTEPAPLTPSIHASRCTTGSGSSSPTFSSLTSP